MDQEWLQLDGLEIKKTVNKCRVRASFTQIFADEYEVVLNVNSQKFLLRFTDDSGSIWDFEILSAKGFVSCLSLNLICSLRGILERFIY